MKQLSLIFSVLFLIFSCTPQGPALPSPAEVTRVSGEVKVERAGEKLPVNKIGFLLNEGDVIQTGRDGKVDFQIPGRGISQVGPRSSVSLDRLRGSRDVRYGIKDGTVLLALKKLGKNDQFEIATPSAIAGVRGTSFLASAEAGESRISVLTGKVELSSAAGEKVLVEEKNESLSKGTALGKPQTIRGSSLAEVKGILQMEGVQKLPEYQKMNDNLKALEILDQKTADEMKLNRDLMGQGVSGNRTDSTENVSGGTNQTGVKRKKDQFSSDKDMMVK